MGAGGEVNAFRSCFFVFNVFKQAPPGSRTSDVRTVCQGELPDFLGHVFGERKQASLYQSDTRALLTADVQWMTPEWMTAVTLRMWEQCRTS